jgi:hypothetical protein
MVEFLVVDGGNSIDEEAAKDNGLPITENESSRPQAIGSQYP